MNMVPHNPNVKRPRSWSCQLFNTPYVVGASIGRLCDSWSITNQRGMRSDVKVGFLISDEADLSLTVYSLILGPLMLGVARVRP